MIFIAGIKYHELRTFTFRELGIPPIDQSKKYTVEVVEPYFHLFFIPIFSLGKKRKLGYLGDFSDLPESIEQKLDKKVVSAPGKWYSFTGIYMIFIAFILFFIDQKVEENRLNKLFAEAKYTQQLYLENPAVGDQYFFVSDGKDIRAEVHNVSSDSIQITVQKAFQYQKSGKAHPKPHFKNDEEILKDFVDVQERKNLISDSLTSSFPKESMLRDLLTQQILGEDILYVQFWISKFDLKKSFCPENNCKGVTIRNSINEFSSPIFLKEVERATTKY